MLFENKLLIGSTILLFELGGLAGIRYLGVLYSQPVLALTESAPNEDSAKYFVNQGVDKAKTGDYRGAIEDLNQAIKLNPNFAAYYNRGLVRSYLGNKLAALEDLNQAIKLNPDFPPAYNNRGVLRSYLGNKLAALEDLNQAIKLNINDNDADAYYNRGMLYYDLGDKTAAISDYKKAAYLYHKQGKTDQYQDVLNKLRKLEQQEG